MEVMVLVIVIEKRIRVLVGNSLKMGKEKTMTQKELSEVEDIRVKINEKNKHFKLK